MDECIHMINIVFSSISQLARSISMREGSRLFHRYTVIYRYQDAGYTTAH